MTTATVRVNNATFARAAYPSREFYTAAKAKLRLQGDTSYAYLYAASPAPVGSTVTNAYIEVTWTEAVNITRTCTVQRLGATKPFQQLNWSNKPSVAAGSTAVSVTQNATNQVYRFDVTADYAAFAAGTKNTGFLFKSTVTDPRYLYGFQAKKGYPRLVVTWASTPPAPTNLVPAEGVVSVLSPTVRFTAGGDTSSVQVQVDPDGDFTVVAWDSGEVVSSVGQLALASTSYPGLAAGATTFWRARVKNAAGWSAWSAVHSWTRVLKPVVTIANPTSISGDPTPPVVWSCANQTAWRVTSTMNGLVVDDSGWRPGVDTYYTPTKGPKKNGQQETVTVYCEDDQDRVATDGDPAVMSAAVTFTLSFDAAIDPVQNLTVDKDRLTPCVWVSWTRTALPDEFAVFRNEELVARFDGTDVYANGVCTWQDWTAPGHQELVYRVAPITNGTVAAGGPEATITLETVGIWVVDPDTGNWFALSGSDGIALSLSETSNVLVPLSAAASIVRRAGVRGLEGTVSGLMEDYRVDGVVKMSWADMDANLIAMRETPGLVARVIAGDFNIASPLPNLSSVVDGETARTGAITKRVTFGVYEQPNQVAGA